MTQDVSITIKEAAAILGLNPSVMWRMCAKQGFPGAVQIGGVWRVKRSCVLHAQEHGWQPTKGDNSGNVVEMESRGRGRR